MDLTYINDFLLLLLHFIYLFIYLFIYFWLCWVFVSVRGLSLAAASGGHSSSRCAGLSLSRPLLLRSTGSKRAGSVLVAHGPSCSAACGIFPDQGSNPCPLHWQADSQPLRHQGSPINDIFTWRSNDVVVHCINDRFHSGYNGDKCWENGLIARHTELRHLQSIRTFALKLVLYV